MAPITSCDHCGRTGVTLGVYYPGRDISQPPIRLCQTYQGIPIEPNCYHLVTERGEQLGIRKVNAIMETDRHSPKVEAVALRFREGGDSPVILTETERRVDAPPPPRMSYGERVQGEHPLTGQRVPMEPPEIPADPLTTKAEEAKGIINPHGADQRPLINPASAEGQAIADAAAEEQAAKITIPGGMGGQVGMPQGNGPRRYPSDAVGDHHGDEFPTPQPISPDDMVSSSGPAPGPTVNTSGLVVQSQPPVDSDAKTPAQVAAEAQAKVDAEEAVKTPAKKAPAKKAAAKKAAPKQPEPPEGTPLTEQELTDVARQEAAPETSATPERTDGEREADEQAAQARLQAEQQESEAGA